MILHRISTIITLFVLAFYVAAPAFLWVNYEFNKSEITELFCINKENPRLQCDGKCHLKTQIDKLDQLDSNQEQDSNSNWQFNWKTDWVNATDENSEIAFQPETNIQFFNSNQRIEKSRFAEDFFHPPQV